ncbi:flagellar basal-body rod protein FlgG [Lachnospiraceae bacterium KH1T2]|nr:flagellar basal-body rod protein FlgG [Lachnospiraceae bacterium KH1T2]
MVRSLWSAASGMIAQQNNVDTIANNLANVNTTGYKTEVNEFKSLLYQTLQTNTTTANGENKPIGAQVGLGVRNSSITSEFTQGSLQASDSNTALAISGKGFFAIRGADSNTYYTRNGDFTFALLNSGEITLTTTDGLQVLDTSGNPISFGSSYIATRFTVGDDGTLYYPDGDGVPQTTGKTIGLYQFQNPKGLNKIGNSLYSVTAASGEVLNENTNNNLEKSTLAVGYLEASNVQIATEMVNLIIAQRAYESNSKAITTTDDMMALANQLKS